MNTITAFFQKELGEVRIIPEDEVLFCAIDVCRCLEIGNITDTLGRLDPDEKCFRQISTLGGVQTMAMLTESGLYDVILTSRKPSAKTFRKWVTKEVLPSIRKNGGYIDGQERLSEDDRKELEAQIRALSEKVERSEKNYTVLYKDLEDTEDELRKAREERDEYFAFYMESVKAHATHVAAPEKEQPVKAADHGILVDVQGRVITAW